VSFAGLLSAFAFLTGFLPNLSIAGAYVAGGGLLAVMGYGLATGRVKAHRTPWDVPFAAFLAVWAAASLAGLDPAASLSRFPTQLRILLCYLLVWAGPEFGTRPALRGYVWGASTAVLYGLLQYAVTKLAGPEAAFWATLPPKAAEYLTLKVGRVHGAVHPLTYAENILPLLFLSVANYLKADDARRAAAAGAGALAVGVTLLLTQSRGPWLGAALGLTVMGILHPRRIRLLPALAVLAALIVLHPALRSRAETLLRGHRDESSNIRLALWRGGAKLWRDNRLTGVGPARLGEAARAYAGRPDWPGLPAGFESDLHNQYLQHAVERGTAGLLALLWLMAVPLRTAWKAWRERGPSTGELPLALTAYFAAFFVVNATERALDDAEVSLVFWTLAACAWAASARNRVGTGASVSPADPGAGGVAR
jgi:O-antigen ligase